MSEESRVLEGEDTRVDMCPGMLGPSRTQGRGGGPATPLTLRPCPLQVTGLSVTSGRDQLVVLHAQGYDDLVVCLHRSQPPLDNRIGELVGVLAAHCQG